METFQQELSEFILQPLVLASLVGFLLALPLISGLSMKWAVELAGGGALGFIRACATAAVAVLAAGITHLLVTLLVVDARLWVSACYSAVAATVAIAVAARCNPFSAAVAYIIHSVLTTLGTASAVVALAIALYFAVDQKLIEPCEAKPPEGQWSSLADRWHEGLPGAKPVSAPSGTPPGAAMGRGELTGRDAVRSSSGSQSSRVDSTGPEATGPRSKSSFGDASGANRPGVRTNPFVTE